jgi:hypothetical protein
MRGVRPRRRLGSWWFVGAAIVVQLLATAGVLAQGVVPNNNSSSNPVLGGPSFELPPPLDVQLDWTDGPTPLPGFEFSFDVPNTNDRTYRSTLTHYNDCATPIDNAGLSLATAGQPTFLDDSNTIILYDRVSVDVTQLSSVVYQVDGTTDSNTMATLQFCHVLAVYAIDTNPVNGTSTTTIDSTTTPQHRSLTKVRAAINLASPFGTPTSLQLTNGSSDNGNIVNVTVMPAVLNVFACDANRVADPLSSLTAGDTLRICVTATPYTPISFHSVKLTATKLSDNTKANYTLVAAGVVPKTSNVPGEVILNGCTDNICSFDYSPSFTFFATGTYNMEIGGTVLLQLGNSNRLLRRRATTTDDETSSDDDPTLVQFKMQFELTPPVDNLVIKEKERGMSMLGVIMGMVVVACALALALAIWARRRLVSSVKAVDPSDNTVMDNDADGRKRKVAREIQVDAEHGGSSSINDEDNNNNGQPTIIGNNVENDHHECRIPSDAEGEGHVDTDDDHCDPDRLNVSEHLQVVDEASTFSDIEIPM